MSIEHDYDEIVANVKKFITAETEAGRMKSPLDTFTAIESALDAMYQRGRKDEKFDREEYEAGCDRWDG